MINVKKAQKYCKEDLSKIENYEQAVNDTTQVWDLHHRTAIWWNCSKKDLIDNECYYNRKACELIFLTHSEHRRLHNMNLTDETKKKRSDSMKGKNKGKIPWNKGKKTTEETLLKMSASLKGKPAWNKGKTVSEETRKKLSEAAKRRYARKNKI